MDSTTIVCDIAGYIFRSLQGKYFVDGRIHVCKFEGCGY